MKNIPTLSFGMLEQICQLNNVMTRPLSSHIIIEMIRDRVFYISATIFLITSAPQNLISLNNTDS